MNQETSLPESLARATDSRFQPLDLLPGRNVVEKLIALVLAGVPDCPSVMASLLAETRLDLQARDSSGVKLVVFGGGSGLSNIIGGDSRQGHWPDEPFRGLKHVFPQTKAIVCVTDDGGSTGEMLKDLPLISLGDLRHVLVSSIQEANLLKRYQLTSKRARQVAAFLHAMFNFRYELPPGSVDELLNGCSCDPSVLPISMASRLSDLLELLFVDPDLHKAMQRPHCLGNLLLAAAIYRHKSEDDDIPGERAIMAGLDWLGQLLGVHPQAVLPCTVTPAHLNILYANGVLVMGENKAAGGYRNSPIRRVFVEFSADPVVPREVLVAIAEADIILFAPGSLYTSIIPIMQIPGLAEEVRQNNKALKVLVANLWIQKGETDLVWNDPHRKFNVSDLVQAYNRNIPGGIKDLFSQLLLLGLRDIPGSILQSYALEDKMPIFLDRGEVWNMGLTPIEAKIFSESLLQERKVQHDPDALAQALKILWAVREQAAPQRAVQLEPVFSEHPVLIDRQRLTPAQRLALFQSLVDFPMQGMVRSALLEVIWHHWDILPEHLAHVKGVDLVKKDNWHRCQQWDKVYSFYDPADGHIKIREDVFFDPQRQEMALLIPLGQALLGNYALQRQMEHIKRNGHVAGKMFRLTLRPPDQRQCFFSDDELQEYLQLVRMVPVDKQALVFTRLINGEEGFTPPGLLMGLTYAWYLDNRHAAHIEYKMAITRIPGSGLVPEQLKMMGRRERMVRFFRKKVFRHDGDRMNYARR